MFPKRIKKTINFNLEKLIFYSIIVFLPTQLGKHFWPPFSYVLGMRVDYLSPTLYLTDILIVALFILLLVKKKSIIRLFQLQNKKKMWTALLSFFALNIYFSTIPTLSIYGLMKIFEYLFFGFYIANNINTRKDLIKLATIFSLTIIFESVLAITQYLNQSSTKSLLYYLGERTFNTSTPGIANASISGSLVLRPYGTFSHPNVLAGFLLIGLVFVYFYLRDIKTLIVRVIRGIALTTGSIALFLTMSRAVVIIFTLLTIFTIAQWFIQKNKVKARNLQTIKIATLILIFIGIYFYTPIAPRILETSFNDKAFTQREELLLKSIEIFQSKPILGVGLFNFIPELGKIQKPTSYTYFMQPVHNMLFLIAVETGVVGLSIFAYFITKTYKNIVAKKTSDKKVLLVVLTIILIIGLIDHYWLTLQQSQLLFALILGLSWAKYK